VIAELSVDAIYASDAQKRNINPEVLLTLLALLVLPMARCADAPAVAANAVAARHA
jgi:hypothetical protein